MSWLDAAAVVLVVLPIANVIASWLLVRLDNLAEPRSDALHSRAQMSLLLSAASLIGAVLGYARLSRYQLDGWGTLLIVAVLVIVSLPQVHWLLIYRRGMK